MVGVKLPVNEILDVFYENLPETGLFLVVGGSKLTFLWDKF